MPTLSPGDTAPDFDLPTNGGRRLRLSKLMGKIAVVYFYPADDTPNCTTEAVSFSLAKPGFDALAVEIIGVSPDSGTSHDNFCRKYDLGITLAADVDRSVAALYGTFVEKSMFGRRFMGVARTTFLIGRDGRIARIWNRVKVKGHAEEVLAAARAL